MNGEYISIKTLRQIKKQRDNIQTSALQLDKIVKEKQQEIEILNNIIDEQDKELELERKSRQLLTDDLANVCEMSLKKENIIKEVRNILEPLIALEGTMTAKGMKKLLEILDKGE